MAGKKKITSKAQWGYLYANDPKVAKEMADNTIGTKTPGTKHGKKVYDDLKNESQTKEAVNARKKAKDVKSKAGLK